jgi:hypothetical protein
VNWQVLDALAAREEGDAEATVIVSALRQAARRDEQEIALSAPLRKASEDAISLFLRAKKPEPVPPVVVPGPEMPVVGSGDSATPTSVPAMPPGERVPARDVPAFVERICEAADENPDAEFDIAWRIVER